MRARALVLLAVLSGCRTESTATPPELWLPPEAVAELGLPGPLPTEVWIPSDATPRGLATTPSSATRPGPREDTLWLPRECAAALSGGRRVACAPARTPQR